MPSVRLTFVAAAVDIHRRRTTLTFRGTSPLSVQGGWPAGSHEGWRPKGYGLVMDRCICFWTNLSP